MAWSTSRTQFDRVTKSWVTASGNTTNSLGSGRTGKTSGMLIPRGARSSVSVAMLDHLGARQRQLEHAALVVRGDALRVDRRGQRHREPEVALADLGRVVAAPGLDGWQAALA